MVCERGWKWTWRESEKSKEKKNKKINNEFQTIHFDWRQVAKMAISVTSVLFPLKIDFADHLKRDIVTVTARARCMRSAYKYSMTMVPLPRVKCADKSYENWKWCAGEMNVVYFRHSLWCLKGNRSFTLEMIHRNGCCLRFAHSIQIWNYARISIAVCCTHTDDTIFKLCGER